MRKRTRWVVLSAFAALVVVVGVSASGGIDWGLKVQNEMNHEADHLFGVERGLSSSSTSSLTQAQALADPASLVTLAKGLRAKVVAAGPDDNVGANADQMVLWPQSHPTHLILVNEEGTTEPGLQKVDLKTGKATTILTGIDDNDPVRVTPWGTIIFGEEATDGAMYEIIDPLDPALEGTVVDRSTQVFTPATSKIRRIDALGFNAFEGLAIMPNGVTYYGNELAAQNGAPGGTIYKFVPTTPRTTGIPPITNLSQSPYASGKVYALRVGTSSNNGQGFQYGTGSWQELVGASGNLLAPLAATVKATGYYRPEDIDIDQKALAAGNVRFCGNNTGRDSAFYWGETVCITDGTVAASASGSTTPQAQLLVQGSQSINMPDNIAYQPRRGNWIVHEDGSTGSQPTGVGPNNDLWSCLEDGADIDTLTDGCLRIGTLNDTTAEWTGGFFDASGRNFYVSVQHNISGYGTILKITGWE
jgi:secreted PhoX family phosphatase